MSKEKKKKSIFDAVDNLDFVTYALKKVGVCVNCRAVLSGIILKSSPIHIFFFGGHRRWNVHLSVIYIF